jgi:hypothetical protein
MEEIKREYVHQQVEEKKLSGREAAQRLGLSLQQVRQFSFHLPVVTGFCT